MKKYLSILVCSFLFITACKNSNSKETKSKASVEASTFTETKITPISHATAVIGFANKIMYLDPTGGAEAFSKFEKPNYVLITDIHGDHMNLKTLQALDLSEAIIIAPKAVVSNLDSLKVKDIITINNGEQKSFSSFELEAIPMYNLREEALKFHSKGRGNGYILTINKERIYFSGDTEDIPEMRDLKNIDKAFICMNLPYTMTVESAADAVLDFKPKKVYPYHYRGTSGLSDVEKFKSLVSQGNSAIEVVQWNWYPNRK